MAETEPKTGRILLRMTVPGDPVPKGRPRFTRTGHAYTPKRTVEAERRIGLMAMAVTKPAQRATDKEVSVRLEFYVRRSADVDNLAKTFLDGLTGVIWNDDRQVTELIAYRCKSKTPETVVLVKERE